MKPELRNDLRVFVEKNVPEFHRRRLERLLELKLDKVLRRKNPYLFKAKNVLIAGDLVRSILDAYLSSQEETLFGTFIEQLAIYVCEQSCGGRKSAVEGIDLELDRDGCRYLISVKSGPDWGNASQIHKMRDYFNKAKRTLATNAKAAPLICINGCSYGQGETNKFGEYRKICGAAFWELISGDPDLFTDIIEPLGYQAKERNEEFQVEYAKVINSFSQEFSNDFCASDGSIDWVKVVTFNSGKRSRRGKAA